MSTRWYTRSMPTVLPRIQVTQTQQLTDALAIAEREWPGAPRSELIARLAAAGAEALAHEREAQRRERREVLERLRGSIAYPAGYRDELRDEWPE